MGFKLLRKAFRFEFQMKERGAKDGEREEIVPFFRDQSNGKEPLREAMD